MSDRGIRSLHVTQVTSGGVRPLILSLLRHSHRWNVYCEIACPQDHYFTQEAESLGAKVHHIPIERSLSPGNLIRSALSLWPLMHNDFDVVHFHSSIAGAVGRPLARLAKIPAVVYTPHCFAFFNTETSGCNRLIYTWVEKGLSRFCNSIIAVSNGEMNDAASLNIAPQSLFEVIEPGIEIDDPFPAETASVKAEFGIPVDSPIIGTIGKMDSQKGIPTFLRAAQIVLSQVPTAKFILVGGEYACSGYSTHMKDLAHQLDLDHAVVFTGHRQDIMRLLSIFDVAVAASLWEGFSVALLEYMAAGIPTVATDVNGVTDAIEDGINGYIVPKESPSSMANKILNLLKKPELRLTMGTNSRQLVNNRFTAIHMAERTCGLYKRLLGLNCVIREPELKQ